MTTTPTVVMPSFTEPAVRAALADTLRCYSQGAHDRNEPTSASLLRQIATLVAHGGGTLSLDAASRHDLETVLHALAAPTERTEVAAVLVKHRPSLGPWARGLFEIHNRILVAMAVMPADATAATDKDGAS